ncbi:hypothetical protein DXG03_003221 [Asterophora parasitica]|uniref:Zn(2)-C6 fungal-type domain-containing protein n=1 Tax=Asterophora parasitica TaxID=117018 RepID=A0A9P7GJT3_9AGAR|nr:hypothetical protein DXG03_003221 [Asterophora parasitica]
MPPPASDGPGASKKRRLPGACDICRRRKIKCDSVHAYSPQKFYLGQRYIRQLEKRVATLEEALKSSPQDNSDATRDSSPQSNLPPSGLLYPPPRPPQGSPPSDSVTDNEEDDDDDDLGYIELTQHFNQMELETLEGRFFGPSRYLARLAVESSLLKF